jgi:hypothetical protein
LGLTVEPVGYRGSEGPSHQHRFHVPVRNRADDPKGLAGREERFAPRATANDLDHVLRQMGEVAQRFMEHLAALPVATAEQIGNVLLALVPASGFGYVT